MIPVSLKLKIRSLNLWINLVLALFIGVQQCLSIVYTDQFVVYVKGGRKVAMELSEKYGYTYLAEIIDGYHHLQHNKVTKRSTETTYREWSKISEEPNVEWFSHQVLLEREKRSAIQSRFALSDLFFNDPLWPKMWYLNRGNGKDMNVKKVWEKGITGKGVVVAVLDDGIEKEHPDIFDNYDPRASYDLNDNDSDPAPRYDKDNSNSHGTRCAGVVAATANNSHCAIGVAYGVSIGGVRMLDGELTDALEARTFTFGLDHIDIYSSSWGPADNGEVVHGPGKLGSKAFEAAIKKGRKGLGAILVWASGNGGLYFDNCNCDGYSNSMWTISVSGATENDGIPWYGEPCSSILATTYSSGGEGERKVVTTDLHHKCTMGHSGTSASAPIAAGIFALALQANPKLTWRDMQHLVVRTSSRKNLISEDWRVNGVGRHVSHYFGYGLMDADALVNLAQKWKTVPEQKMCTFQEQRQSIVPSKEHLIVKLSVNCEDVNYLEHVLSKITISASKRSDLKIDLISPMGTKSELLTIRPHDNSSSGFEDWPFTTVHTWEESPNGMWTLKVYNDNEDNDEAVLKNWTMIMYGTSKNHNYAP